MMRLVLLLGFLLIQLQGFSQVRINEVNSLNDEVYDSFGQATDWIEVKNFGLEAVNLSSYYLSDNENDLYKWQMPQLILEPDQLIIFHSADEYTSEMHFNFGISSSGESVFLSKLLIGIQDVISVPELRLNDSYGLDESNVLKYFRPSTPQLENTNGKTGYSEELNFSSLGDYYYSAVSIDISDQCANGTIRYTTDGSFPTLESEVLASNLEISDTKTIKAICTQPEKISSNAHSNTYLINKFSQLPIISLTVDSDSLFDPEVGIYELGPNADEQWPYFGANYWSEKNIKVTFEYFEAGDRQLVQEVDLKIHGGKSSRNKPQRPLRLTARSKYGDEDMSYQFFKDKPQELNFKHLILRNSGSDFLKSNIRDGYWHHLALKENLDFDVFGFQPTIVLLNGEYWGVMNLRERVSEIFIAESNGIEPDSILIMEKENTSVIGDTIHFHNFKEFVTTEDLNVTENWNIIQNELDIPSYLDYFSTEIFAGNLDWPANNIKYWKESPNTGKWHYIMFDLDTTMELFEYIPIDLDMFEFIFGEKSWAINSQIFISLLENEEFKRNFINRLADLMNTSFTEESLTLHLEEILVEIEPEIQGHFNRWWGDINKFREETEDRIPRFFNQRHTFVQEQIVNHFGLEEAVNISIEVFPKDAGEVKLNTITPELPFTGVYFNGNDIDLTALAHDGYLFKEWSYSEGTLANKHAESVKVNIPDDGRIVAFFDKPGQTLQPMLIANSAAVENSAEVIIESDLDEEITLVLTDISGKEIYRINKQITNGKNLIRLPANDLTQGLYVVSKFSNNSISTKKFFKK